MDPRIQTVISMVQETLSRQTDLEQLARQANMSASHLRHLFKLETGTTLSRHIKQARLDKAEGLLRTTFLSVKEIMNKVGITNESYFSREFKKSYGSAPGKYRTSLKDQS